MNEPRKYFISLLKLVLFSFLLAVIAYLVLRQCNKEKTPTRVSLKEVNDAYHRASVAPHEKFNAAEKEDFYKHWLEILEDSLARSSEKDPAREQILSNILALQTSLGKYEEALKTSQFIIQFDPKQKNRMLFNDSEIALTKAYSGNATPDLKSALPYYERAWPVMKEEQGRRAFSFYQKYGDLLNELGRPEKAMEVYLHGYERGLKEGGSKSSDHFDTFSPEWFLDAAMKAAYASGDAQRGGELFQQLIKLPGLYNPASSYFYEMSGFVDKDRKEQFQQLTEDWLKAQKPDEWTPKLRTHLATSYFKQNKFQNAAKIYTSLLETPFGRPAKGETKSVDYKKEILFNLACSLHALGEKDEAFKLFHSFAALYKDDSRVKQIPQI